ncbi:hypothetical protein DCAR_0209281 [Daucus carota subsp. sativus]|uniref:Uncharacterized protein n=1 Tax=Daucus carota subsp. sativus TaxID=79200 RepID=A0A161XJE4_DAUCS|nr:hypothetical protein DCAR_0209281 [Daucus carota subsp. sativus]
MAHFSSTFLLTSTLAILLLATPSASQGTPLNLPAANLSSITQLQVLGFLACPLTSIPLVGSILGGSGVPVSVKCNGIDIGDPSALTDAFGFFSIPVPGFNTSALNLQPQQISCSVTVDFPLSKPSSCQTFPSTGSLQAPLSFGSLLQNGLGKLIALLNPGPFQYRA